MRANYVYLFSQNGEAEAQGKNRRADSRVVAAQ